VIPFLLPLDGDLQLTFSQRGWTRTTFRQFQGEKKD